MPAKTIIALISITLLLAIALIMGHNGVLLAGGIATLAGLGGYEVGKHRKS